MLVPWRVIALRHVPGPVQAIPEAKQAALQFQSNESFEVGWPEVRTSKIFNLDYVFRG